MGDASLDRKNMEEFLNNTKANSEHFEMLLKQKAEWCWLSFTFLKEQGFSEEQALEIICRRGSSL